LFGSRSGRTVDRPRHSIFGNEWVAWRTRSGTTDGSYLSCQSLGVRPFGAREIASIARVATSSGALRVSPQKARAEARDGPGGRRFPFPADQLTVLWSGVCRLRLLAQYHLALKIQNEPSARLRDQADALVLLLEASAEQEQPTLEIVPPFRELQRLVESQLAI
jgi:hypothetical protein